LAIEKENKTTLVEKIIYQYAVTEARENKDAISWVEVINT